MVDVEVKTARDLKVLLEILAKMDGGAGLLVDVTDRWLRQLGQIDLMRVRGANLSAPNPVVVGVYDANSNRMPAMDTEVRRGFQEIVTGGAVIAAGNPLPTQDTGLNTNPERWLHDNHWDSGAELVLNAAAAVNLGVAVGAGVTRRVRSITVRNTAQANTVITLSQVAPPQNRVSFDVLAQTTRVWSEQDGVEFLAGVQVQISSSAAAVGAETYIHAAGVEA